MYRVSRELFKHNFKPVSVHSFFRLFSKKYCFLSSRTKNRSTFTCPLCNQRNFDSNGLLQHVNSNHKNERQSVVGLKVSEAVFNKLSSVIKPKPN